VLIKGISLDLQGDRTINERKESLGDLVFNKTRGSFD
jgi:hypothetical protein